jgi:hypothetical protein
VVTFLPSFSLAAMVFVIETLVISMTMAVLAPIRISLAKGLPVLRVFLIPRMPLRPIPIIRPDNIDLRISIIRGPSIPVAVEVIQHAI